MGNPKATIFRDEAGGWRWRLRAANGEIVAVGESYTRKADAVRGWKDARAAFYGDSSVAEDDEVEP